MRPADFLTSKSLPVQLVPLCQLTFSRTSPQAEPRLMQESPPHQVWWAAWTARTMAYLL
jgi:hypothetical protein